MRTNGYRWVAALLAAVLAGAMGPLARAAEPGATFGSHWESWQAHATVSDRASLQRGARDFVGYCLGCH